MSDSPAQFQRLGHYRPAHVPEVRAGLRPGRELPGAQIHDPAGAPGRTDPSSSSGPGRVGGGRVVLGADALVVSLWKFEIRNFDAIFQILFLSGKKTPLAIVPLRHRVQQSLDVFRQRPLLLLAKAKVQRCVQDQPKLANGLMNKNFYCRIIIWVHTFGRSRKAPQSPPKTNVKAFCTFFVLERTPAARS